MKCNIIVASVGLACFVTVAAFAIGPKVEAAPSITPTPYEQCMREIREICWQLPPGDERIQCYVEGDAFCEGRYG